MEETFNRVLSRILVFSTATTLMLTAAGVFSSALNNYEVDKIYVNFFVYLMIGISGVVYSLVLQIFAKEKIKSAMHIVFIVFYVAIVVGISALIGQGYVPYILIPFLLIQYFICIGINEMFVFHEKFISDCEKHEGKELETYLFHNNLSAIDLTEKTKNQQAILFGLSVAMFIILVFGKLADGFFNPVIDVLIILFFLSVLLCYFVTGQFRNDIFYAFLGFKNYVINNKRLLSACLLIFILSGSLAVLISSDNPLIKINYVEEYKERVEENKQPAVTSSTFTPLPEFDFEEAFGKDSKPNWIIELIFQIIKYAVIIFLGGSVVYFLVRPFFTRHWKSFWAEGRLGKFLKELWADIKNFFKYLFTRSKKNAEAYSTVQGKKFHASMMEFLKKAKRSKEKEAEIDRLTKHFIRLLNWGEKHKIRYTQNLAPAEYTALIEKEVEQDLQTAAHTAGTLFEKALYDKEILTKEEESCFVGCVEKIVNSED